MSRYDHKIETSLEGIDGRLDNEDASLFHGHIEREDQLDRGVILQRETHESQELS